MVPDPDEIGIKPLTGDGDFRSAESIELLKQADVVVTQLSDALLAVQPAEGAASRSAAGRGRGGPSALAFALIDNRQQLAV